MVDAMIPELEFRLRLPAREESQADLRSPVPQTEAFVLPVAIDDPDQVAIVGSRAGGTLDHLAIDELMGSGGPYGYDRQVFLGSEAAVGHAGRRFVRYGSSGPWHGLRLLEIIE